MNSHPKQHPSRCLSDYTNQIHYTKSDLHERRCSFKGEHQSVHHIIHMTHALPFGYPCSEAMSVHARLVKLNLSIPHVQIWLAPVVCTRRVYHTRSSRDASKRRVFATVHTKDEHFIILIFSERDHLIVLPSWSKQYKIHKKRINITCNSLCDMIWPFYLCLWSSSPKHGHDLHHHQRGVKVHGAASWLSITYSNYNNYLNKAITWRIWHAGHKI